MADGPARPDPETAHDTEEQRLWDPALRAFHWLLAALVAASVLTAWFGPVIMTLHFQLGYATAALLVFRLVWGLVGPAPARFGGFVRGPAAVARYAATVLRRQPSHWPGHNPLGGWAVVALLALVAAKVLTGLIADPEDFVNVGPLAGFVPAAMARAADGWHASLTDLLIGLVALHVAAVYFYRFWKREDLVTPMITGRKQVRRERE